MIRHVIALLALLGAIGSAPAQTYPVKPIRLIVPFTPGGGTDFVARLTGTKLSQETGWTIVPDNKPGAGGTIGILEAVRASPQGYDLVMGQSDNLVIAPLLQKDFHFNSAKDLVPVALVSGTTFVLLTGAGSSYRSFADVVSTAKSSPTPIAYGSAGSGTFPHLAVELLQSAGGFKLQHIPYKGASPAIADLLGGHIGLAMLSVGSAMPQIQAGKLRALAVTSAQRNAALPDVPTIAESGYKDFDATGWSGVLAPAGTPREIVIRLNAEINKAMQKPDVRKTLVAQGIDSLSGTPEEFAAILKNDTAKWKRVVDSTGIKID
jgi:tripartite-type tricarboxylate transporter receptor subunit TctC